MRRLWVTGAWVTGAWTAGRMTAHSGAAHARERPSDRSDGADTVDVDESPNIAAVPASRGANLAAGGADVPPPVDRRRT
ncbi:hypothetical protein FHR81_003342 [Actinoalloteichus hoggarensis]|uniref:Uncharacterized protein n=1 Tax=Actinoalloteichus hoggarensis TaxID=1470176 RepID=A0A221W740_9PSEU|nr:hypothetical protein AHOG_20390 [Actinoalloteichus hoggarensis]MBB5922290.1 hypothetical protein [Actinoalloteichus hoggarensis]